MKSFCGREKSRGVFDGVGWLVLACALLLLQISLPLLIR
ncbi:hypothetical protein SAMN02745866_01332 [Alteromonadaceae bacterium Bs31]|nr:hypothetical protein SAMN02745866_01332 [Alteromonadaceae bacterium Bs31]